jgi:O-methyltransferase domain/Dimerisation domain
LTTSTGPRAQASPEAAAQVRRILSGVRLSQAVSVAASLGIPDALADGPRNANDLAAALGTDPPTTYRLLRTLAAGGILHESEERVFSLTDLGAALRSDVAGSVREQAILFGKSYVLGAWGNLEHSIRTGENAFTALNGEDIWAWRARDPDEESAFNRAMASASAPVGPALAAADAFQGAATVADIGGGSGTLLAAVLSAHPGLNGVLFDQPSVVAQAAPILAAAGVDDRTELVGGSFFESVPTADVYLMKAILHDWPDAECLRILRTIRAASNPKSRLLVIERVLGGPNHDLAGKLMDLHMLVMPGGLERTLDEWRELFSAGGFELIDPRPLVQDWQVIEGRPT